uniref:non-specific serine/threonine protein kinase n=1 Tax=Sinocyclocheilus rhinocerous TaxID=307959 RepID=A0A673LG64_9TELE
NFSLEEDHLAHIIELLGMIPVSVALSGKYSYEYFNRKGDLCATIIINYDCFCTGDLRRIAVLRPWGLYEVLVEKYDFLLREASLFSDFLLQMLDFLPERRATAAQCLKHPWLKL